MMIAKGIYVGEWHAGSHSVGRPWKRWIDTMKDFRKNRFGCQASRIRVNGGGL